MSKMSHMYGMRDMHVPCQGCEFREVGCHATCEQYKAFKENRAEQKKKVIAYRKEHTNDLQSRSYISDSTLRKRKENSYLNILNSNKRAVRGE